MRISFSNLLALQAVITLADALPFLPIPGGDRPLERRKVTYSVVPVDGGSTGAAAATTVTEPASTLSAVTETKLSTLLSTIFATEYEAPSTVVVTVTATPSQPFSGIASIEATSTPSCSEYTTTITTTSPTTQMTTMTSILTPALTEYTTSTMAPTNITTPATVVSVTTWSPEVVTVTVSPSSTPYDDGMWHTIYFHPIYETSSLSSSTYSATSTTSSYPSSSTVTAPSEASTSLDINIGIPGNSTSALKPRDLAKRTPKTDGTTPTHIITTHYPTTESDWPQ